MVPTGGPTPVWRGSQRASRDGAPGCATLDRCGSSERERSDTTAVPAAGVILQCVIGLVIADAIQEKFGGDTLAELHERVAAAHAYAQAY